MRIIVPFGPGGGTDIQGRLLGKKFYESMRETNTQSLLVLAKAIGLSWDTTRGIMAQLVKTAEWREFLKRELLDDAFLTGPALQQFTKSYSEQMRQILKEGGLAVLR